MPPKRAILLVFALIFAVGLAEGVLEGRRSCQKQREYLRLGALHNANAFPPQVRRSLTGTPVDVGTRQHHELQRLLAAARVTHPAIGYVSILRVFPSDGHVICLAASGPESEASHIPEADTLRDHTPDATAAREIASGKTDFALNLFHQDWNNQYWVSGYARCPTDPDPAMSTAAVAIAPTPIDIFRYDIDAKYWFTSIGEDVLVHTLAVWLLLGLPFAAYLLGKRHKNRALHILQLGQAVEQADTAILIVRIHNSEIKYANRRFCELLGYTFDELRGRRWLSLRPVERTDRMLAQRCAMIFEGISIEAEWDFRRKDESIFPVRSTATPIRDETGKIIEVIFVVIDITEHRRQALLLQKEKEKAEQEDHTKTLLIASTNKEVRFPLSEIDRISQEIADTPLNQEQAGYAATIRASSISLKKLTQDIIDFSYIESGHLRIDPVHVDPGQLITEALDMVRADAVKRNITLLHDVASDVPRQIIIAADRLRQVLLNLIGNAIKFTQTGEIEIRLKSLRVDTLPAVSPEVIASIEENKHEGTLTLLFSVRDTGIGIDREQQKKLFVPFWQANSGNTRQYEGAGLGLAISQQLVQMLGGEINVESKPDMGTTFHFSVNCTVPSEVKESAPPC